MFHSISLDSPSDRSADSRQAALSPVKGERSSLPLSTYCLLPHCHKCRIGRGLFLLF